MTLDYDELDAAQEDIYCDENNLKQFLSIDIVSANFTALWYYDPSILKHKDTWHRFLATFTDCEYILKSKSFRQKVFHLIETDKLKYMEKSIINTVIEAVGDLLEGVPYVTNNDEACYRYVTNHRLL